MEWILSSEREPKKRGEYLAFSPPVVSMGRETNLGRRVLAWTGKRWMSSFPVSHWCEIPAAPTTPQDGIQ